MQRAIIIGLLFSFSTLSVNAQDQEVLQVIDNLFIAMETSDSSLAQSMLTEDAQLFTVFTDQDGNLKRRQSPASALPAAFGKEKTATWREPIWNQLVRIDGGLAMVWTDYAFYVDDQLSHCGVDAFLLEKTSGQWKIYSITDTRRTDCNIPKEILEKSKTWAK
jgi:hypothetical protein